MRRSSQQRGFPLLASAFGEESLQLRQPQVAPRTFSIFRLSLLKCIDLACDAEVSSITPQNVELWKNRAVLHAAIDTEQLRGVVDPLN
jgi:hypothetical protein